MKTLINSRLAAACALATISGVLVLQSPALAGNHSGKRDGRVAPRWGSKTVQTQRTDTGHEQHTTWTGQNGKTATRDAVVTNDRDAGTRSRAVTSIGPNGKTRTASDVTTRTDSGYNRETVVTHADGSTLTRDVTSSYDPETKTHTKKITVDRDPPPANDAG